MSALAAAALPQPDPVKRVLAEAQPQKAELVAPRSRKVKKSNMEARAASGSQQASRQGKVGIQFWTDPETRKRLKIFAMEANTTLDDVMRKAVADFMRKNKIA